MRRYRRLSFLVAVAVATYCHAVQSTRVQVPPRNKALCKIETSAVSLHTVVKCSQLHLAMQRAD